MSEHRSYLSYVGKIVLISCAQDGRSALVETARSKRYGDERVLGEIARLLIEAGSDVDLKCADLGEVSFSCTTVVILNLHKGAYIILKKIYCMVFCCYFCS